MSMETAASRLGPWDAAARDYFNAFWSIHDIEVLFHHFCTMAPWRHPDAPAYTQSLQRLEAEGLMDGRDVTAEGVRLIARICDVRPQASGGER